MSIKIDHAAQAAYEEYLEEQEVDHREATLRGDFATLLDRYIEQVAVIAAVQPLSPLEQKLVDETVRLIESDERYLRRREVLDGFDPDREQTVYTVAEYCKLVDTISPLTVDEHREFSLKLRIIEAIEQNA